MWSAIVGDAGTEDRPGAGKHRISQRCGKTACFSLGFNACTPFAGEGVTSSRGATARSGVGLRLEPPWVAFLASCLFFLDGSTSGCEVTEERNALGDMPADITMGAAGTAAAAPDTMLPAAALTEPNSPVAAAAAPSNSECTELLSGVEPFSTGVWAADAAAPSLFTYTRRERQLFMHDHFAVIFRIYVCTCLCRLACCSRSPPCPGR